MKDEHPEIEIHYFEEDIKFNDLLVVVTHPTIGTISSIVGNYLVQELDLRLIGAFLSPELSPTAMVYNGVPEPPIRIYAGEYNDDPTTDFDQIVVIASDLPMERKFMYELSDRIIEWSKFNNARAILTIEAINREELRLENEVKVFSLTTNGESSSYVEGIDGLLKFRQGMVSGMTGLLQYKGRIAEFPVISFLAEAHENFPDSRSAAAVLAKLNKLVPKITIDPEPLLQQAEKVEDQIRQALSQIKQQQGPPKHKAPVGMFA